MNQWESSLEIALVMTSWVQETQCSMRIVSML